LIQDTPIRSIRTWEVGDLTRRIERFGGATDWNGASIDIAAEDLRIDLNGPAKAIQMWFFHQAKFVQSTEVIPHRSTRWSSS
jgi:hypothetical protein